MYYHIYTPACSVLHAVLQQCLDYVSETIECVRQYILPLTYDITRWIVHDSIILKDLKHPIV